MIKLPTFKGGIHLPEHKELTERKKIKDLPPPPRVIIPLNQNVGSPPRPVVKVGQKVAMGEVIAEPSGRISSTLHASVSGLVTGLDLFPYPAGPDSRAAAAEACSVYYENATNKFT